MNIRDKQILKIALPSIVSNITVPLLSLVDVAIVGHLGAPSYIGAIAVGGLMFNVIYWLFAFLRMGTTGMTSQALGQRDLAETVRMIMRALIVGLSVSFLLLLLQRPLSAGVLALLSPSADVVGFASAYYSICIWGAPAVLSLYAFSGWFVGMQNSRAPMAIAIVQNVVNILASLLFVYVFGMKVEGVALGTLIAQYAGVAMALAIWMRHYRRLLKFGKLSLRNVIGVEARATMLRFFKVNTDIFFRTLCIVAVTMFFTSASAAQGDVMLAVNTLLTQFFTIFSYVMDGFAFAGEALAGKAVGAHNRAMFSSVVGRLFLWGTSVALLFTAAYSLGGYSFIGMLTNEAEVVAVAADYLPVVALLPLCAFTGFVMDGIFIGATATRQMLISMLVALAVFFIVYSLASAPLGNYGLWTAFLTYLFTRGAAQLFLFRMCGHRLCF